MNASVKFILDSKPLSNNLYTVYLRVIKDRKRKNIRINIKCKKEHFENEQFLRGHSGYKELNKLLNNLKAKAEKIIRDFQLDGIDFTFEEFERKFKNKPDIRNYKVSDFYNEIIDELERSGRMSYAKSYKDTRNSFLKFAGNNLLFRDINSMVIEKYEVYLREIGNQNGGIAFKMRHLRSLFNIAIKRKAMSKNNYPFEVYKISKIKSESNKRALSIDEFKKIKNADLSLRPELIEAYNYFMFSIYTRGMNFADMANLKWENISNDRIIYKRSKTKHRFNIEISEEIQEILNYYKYQNRSSEYVFPILLRDDLTPKQIAYRKHKVLQRYNKKLKEIAKIANVEQIITSYVARHSFATILKYLGTSVELISEMMGHSNVEITKSYLKDFGDEILDTESRKILNL